MGMKSKFSYEDKIVAVDGYLSGKREQLNLDYFTCILDRWQFKELSEI